MNKLIVEAYIKALEGIIDTLDVKPEGVGFVTGKPKYHLVDPSVIRLAKVTASEIGYGSNHNDSSRTGPLETLYWTFNGHGLYSPKEIRKELSDLIKAAKQSCLLTKKPAKK